LAMQLWQKLVEEITTISTTFLVILQPPYLFQTPAY